MVWDDRQAQIYSYSFPNPPSPLCRRWEGVVDNIRPHVKQEVWPALRAALATFKRRIASIQVGGQVNEPGS